MTIGYFLPLRSSKLPEKGSIVLQTVISTTADRFVSPSTKSTRKARASQPMILNFDGKLSIARDTGVHRLSPCVDAAGHAFNVREAMPDEVCRGIHAGNPVMAHHH